MLFYKNEWQLMPYIANYKQYNQEFEEYVADKTDKQIHLQVGNITNLTFENAKYEQDVLIRLEEVKGYPESERNTVHEYVMENNIVSGTPLSISKQIETLEQAAMELAMAQLGGMF